MAGPVTSSRTAGRFRSQAPRRLASPARGPRGRRGAAGRAGAILLEVLIALTIFVLAATVVGSAMRSSIDAVNDIRRAGHAADLAQSVLAELTVAALELVDTPPTPFVEGQDENAAAEEGWTYQIGVEDVPGAIGLKKVTVIVTDSDPRRPEQCRLTQWMVDPAADLGQSGEFAP